MFDDIYQRQLELIRNGDASKVVCIGTHSDDDEKKLGKALEHPQKNSSLIAYLQTTIKSKKEAGVLNEQPEWNDSACVLDPKRFLEQEWTPKLNEAFIKGAILSKRKIKLVTNFEYFKKFGDNDFVNNGNFYELLALQENGYSFYNDENGKIIAIGNQEFSDETPPNLECFNIYDTLYYTPAIEKGRIKDATAEKYSLKIQELRQKLKNAPKLPVETAPLMASELAEKQPLLAELQALSPPSPLSTASQTKILTEVLTQKTSKKGKSSNAKKALTAKKEEQRSRVPSEPISPSQKPTLKQRHPEVKTQKKPPTKQSVKPVTRQATRKQSIFRKIITFVGVSAIIGLVWRYFNPAQDSNLTDSTENSGLLSERIKNIDSEFVRLSKTDLYSPSKPLLPSYSNRENSEQVKQPLHFESISKKTEKPAFQVQIESLPQETQLLLGKTGEYSDRYATISQDNKVIVTEPEKFLNELQNHKKAVAARLKFPGLTGIEKKFLKEESLILEDRLTFMNDLLTLSKKSKSSLKPRK